MALFSFGKKPESSTPLGPQQVEQRAHDSVHTPSSSVPEPSDISQTLDKITGRSSPLRVTEIDPKRTRTEIDVDITSFVNRKPENLYIIDGEKNVTKSIICTSDSDGGKTCLKLQISSIELFKTMQKLEYFCSLPDDISATYFECRKIQ
ncbi:predicted protein [Scheffersomyces stipitis CBS 6054]|uniref:Uncharacterized protein n=1 Tax=Scheffersomyces stipitis (strain ATCC 58785 / CBS 6054 / NBRC 10063 / NRRL Y-11545) TaxID=322104 RepID=A3LTG6_PICST|nr:predicted protein [Scheffersomyces stipitis CBS 6054]ABN66402.2 predicted protein [Scheffersomyces stipitis CBS 6054]KAG2733196.1 hypothetical protein G9P44_004186 [Scheffersomyces stipitis]